MMNLNLSTGVGRHRSRRHEQVTRKIAEMKTNVAYKKLPLSLLFVHPTSFFAHECHVLAQPRHP